MKLKLLLVLDNANRELVSINLLKYFACEANLRVKVCSRYNIKTYVSNYNPDYILHCNWIDIKDEYSLTSRQFLLSAESGNGQKQQVIDNHSDKNNSNFDSLIDHYFVWGQNSKNILTEELEINPSKISVTGHPITDNWLKRKKPKKGTGLGISTSFRAVNNGRNKINNLEWIYEAYLTRESRLYFDHNYNVEDFCAYETMIFRIYSQIIELQTLGTINDDILFKPHPLENVASYKYFTKLNGNKITAKHYKNMFQWLDNVYVNIQAISGSVFESYIYDTPIIDISELENNSNLNFLNCFNYEFTNYLWKPKTMSEFIELVKLAKKGKLSKVKHNEDFKKYMKDNHNFPRINSSASLIVNEIIKYKPLLSKSKLFNNNNNLRGIPNKVNYFIPDMKILYLYTKSKLQCKSHNPFFTYLKLNLFKNFKAKIDSKNIIKKLKQK